MKYKKLFKHKRKSNRETSSFSKNSSREIYQLKDGSTIRQSYLSGRKQRYNKNDRPIGKEY
uniref:ORF22 n=1 Tax=Nitrosopumilaceae spindle-shaped virus TaxID=3065433 RepID=A0AAT9J9L4_9VIRU